MLALEAKTSMAVGKATKALAGIAMRAASGARSEEEEAMKPSKGWAAELQLWFVVLVMLLPSITFRCKQYNC